MDFLHHIPFSLGGLLKGVASIVFAMGMILLGPRIVSVLIVKYLRKRRIAWVSLVAVILCTTMVLVVISVMGGWLRMFRLSFHGLSGDIQVRDYGLGGFPHYEQMVERIEQLPEVGKGNAVPVILTFGLITFNNNLMDKVQVLGYPIDQIGAVNDFSESLFRQGKQSREWAANEIKRLKSDKTAKAGEDAEYLEYLQLKSVEPVRPPSFGLLEEAYTPLEKLPTGVVFPNPVPPTAPPDSDAVDLSAPVRYDADNHLLTVKGILNPPQQAQLAVLSSDPTYQKAVHDLAIKSRRDVVPYKLLQPNAAKRNIDVTTWPGLIPGVGVIGIHRDKTGQTAGRGSGVYQALAKLTVLGITPGQRGIDLSEKSERNYWIVDDSHTRIYAYDSTSVYVPFDVLQRDLRMDATPKTDTADASPARTSEIFIRVKNGANLDTTRDKVAAIVNDVLTSESHGQFLRNLSVQTWEQSQRTYLSAIENEKALVTFLFGMISIVAVFLIFCIFYMIVVEKTRDIGIVKSVGATSFQIAGIFLGYGLAIGLVGAGMGFLFGYLIVHNINEIHAWLGRALGLVIWNPEVYQFDTIPNSMNPPEVAVILLVAVVSAVLGALVPAIRAARLNPVEALRWE